MMRKVLYFAVTSILLILSIAVSAADSSGRVCASETEINNQDPCFDAVNIANSAKETPAEKESPWLLAPMISSNPKMGSSIGAMAAYLYKFDEESPSSMFGVFGNYSDTDSHIVGAFGRFNFDRDHQRLILGHFDGKVNNDYDDFLGTGLSVKTEDDIRISVLQYLYRVKGDWFIGAQAVDTEYRVRAENRITQEILDLLELSGFASRGAGAVVKYDSRDNINSPSKGSEFTANNIVFSERLGGDVSFDSYGVKYRSYFSHGSMFSAQDSASQSKDNVLAVRLDGRWTSDAPKSGYSSIDLRGYLRGNYLAKHMTVIEAEERYKINRRWAAAVFAGSACLYSNSSDCGQADNWYPSGGAGIIFTLKQEEKMVIRLDYAWGEGDNEGLYFQFGQPF